MSEAQDPKFATFQPKNLAPNGVEIRSFKPQSLSDGVAKNYQQVKEQFGSLATNDPASNPHFHLNAASKRGLGVEAEERNHLEGKVMAEVESRIEQLTEQAYQEGFAKGRDEGAAQAKLEFQEQSKPLFDQFTAFLESFEQLKREMYGANEQFLMQLIYQISKHVILKELATDSDYIQRLISNVIEKVGAKENIRIKISAKDQGNIDSLKELLKVQHPDFKNIQIEVSDELALGGCKVETDFSRLDASIEVQLAAFAKTMGES